VGLKKIQGDIAGVGGLKSGNRHLGPGILEPLNPKNTLRRLAKQAGLNV